jgi:hypothetical protein
MENVLQLRATFHKGAHDAREAGGRQFARQPLHVMPGLVPGIHVLLMCVRRKQDVDGRDIGERSDAVL